jgi:GNAT superfamily N-acetyltransferase
MHIRSATQEDIPVIRQLAEVIWRPTYTPLLGQVQVQYMLDNMYSTDALTKQMAEGQMFLMIHEEERPVGFAAYSRMNAEIYKLNKIYIDPALQGKGFGTALLNSVMERILALGANRLQLNVNRYNKARAFYEHRGFTILYDEDIDIGSGYFMNDYVMEKELRN